jgi:DNA-binding XRE family transcriptional regulator
VTTFKSALMVCGLSQKAAAEFLNVSENTIKAWCSEKKHDVNPPLGIWRLLASLFEQIQDAADGAADVMDIHGVDPRAYGNIEADIPGRELPTEGSLKAAGAMALLMCIAAADTTK